MPPPFVHRGILFVVLIGTFSILAAQQTGAILALGTPDSIAVSAYAGEADASPPLLRADWIGVDGAHPRFSLHYLKEFKGSEAPELTELIVSGVEQYLDQRIHFERSGVKTTMPVGPIGDGVDRMMALACTQAGIPVVALSEATRRQLARLAAIDWSKATFGVDGGDDQEKYMAIYFYVRAQRQELERNLRSDLLPLAGLRVPGSAGATAGTGPKVLVPTVCSTVFDDDNYLCALDLRPDSGLAAPDVQLTDAMLADIAAKAERMQPPVAEHKLRKRDRWLKAELDAINHRIDQTDQRKELWALRDRMDDLENRMDDIGLQVDGLERNRARDRQTENPVAGLSALTGKNVSVRFGTGSAALDSQGKLLLNEVARAMAQSGEGRVLVTGHTDASGAPAVNMALSEQRAKAVRDYLLQRGIGGERLLLNYSGASRSTGSDAAERRVELEWLR